MNLSNNYYNFFSIIIPAHNEEKIIGKTLAHLKNIGYPNDRYEVIVVENASTDQTYNEAKKFESDNFKIYTSTQKGVSAARNLGIKKASSGYNWAVIIDADNILAKGFLSELNQYLNETKNIDFGTTCIRPYPSTTKSRFWFWYRNWSDKLFRIMHTIHIVRKDLLDKVKYDEELSRTEDVVFSWDLGRLGKYFFMNTDKVLTSTRRFEEKGYVKMFFLNIYIGILPKKINKKKDWEIIR